MTYCNYTFNDSTIPDRKRSSRKISPQVLIGNAALGCIALACAWTLYSNLAGSPGNVATATAVTAAPSLTVAMLDPTYFRGYPPDAFSKPALAKSDRLAVHVSAKSDRLQVAALPEKPEAPKPQDVAPPPPQDLALPEPQLAFNVPLPTPRPSELRVQPSDGPSRRDVTQANKVAALAPPAPVKPPSIFEKLFGKQQSPGPMLAYASPDGGIGSNGQSTTSGGLYDRQTAVYDISARTVYMPDGTKLEAHSGLGDKLDDPRYVNVRMRGATPPHVYDLTMRESLFHGVQALRLNPVGGEGNIFGRTGLLAHTYMLGPNGNSNGCVSFKNYQAFLRAYKNNEVKRLVVVARLI